jgi:site-specific DNA-methyltransferase (adenine-specific)
MPAVVLDPFGGGGSTLAAANALGYESIGVELDPHYFAVAKKALVTWSKMSAQSRCC